MDHFLRQSALKFLVQIFSEMNSAGLFLKPNWEIDHLCYRVESLARYEEMKKFFANEGNLLAETLVSGRMIATYKLDQPIEFKTDKKTYIIPLIELPAPKTGKIVKEGFEHFELVCEESFDEIMRAYPDLKFDTSGFAKNFNKELEVIFQSGAMKFHHQSLEKVIELENS
jgi:predicted metalloenzyme YecM